MQRVGQQSWLWSPFSSSWHMSRESLRVCSYMNEPTNTISTILLTVQPLPCIWSKTSWPMGHWPVRRRSMMIRIGTFENLLEGPSCMVERISSYVAVTLSTCQNKKEIKVVISNVVIPTPLAVLKKTINWITETLARLDHRDSNCRRHYITTWLERPKHMHSVRFYDTSLIHVLWYPPPVF